MSALKILGIIAALTTALSFSTCKDRGLPLPKQESYAVVPVSKSIINYLDSSKVKVIDLAYQVKKKTTKIVIDLDKMDYQVFDPRIEIEDKDVKQLSGGIQSANLLFDNKTNTAWFTGWATTNYPMKCEVDLSGCKHLSKIRVYDGAGSPTLTIKADGKDIVTNILEGYQIWKEFEINTNARKIEISINEVSGSSPISEVEFYGIKCDSILDPIDPIDPPIDPPNIPTNPESDAFSFGTNGFHWIPTNKLKGFNHLRQYIVWDWIESERGKYRFEPTAKADGNFDSYWAILKGNKIEPIACVNQSPLFITSTYPNPNPDFRPCVKNDDPLKPQSYLDFARFWFQLSARYGTKVWPESALSVDSTPRWTGEPTNVKKSGLGLLKYCEVWNEPDKWWLSNTPGYIEAEQYAAMLSACYDGHEGRMGSGVGIKTADPYMQVVIGGLTEFDSLYITKMSNWFKANRTDKRFCADVMNFHHYCNADGGIFKGREQGIAPEIDNIQAQMKRIIAVCKKLNPNAKIWWSEFGYDTNASSPHYIKPSPNITSEEQQGNWIARSYLEAIAAGFDAAHIYNAIDEPNPNGGLFQSSGILTGQNGNPKFSDKQGYSTVMTLANELSGYTYIHSDELNGVRKMLFKNGSSVKVALWMPCEQECSGKTKIAGIDVIISQTPKIITLF
jgi:hypothetical protein